MKSTYIYATLVKYINKNIYIKWLIKWRKTPKQMAKKFAVPFILTNVP